MDEQQIANQETPILESQQSQPQEQVQSQPSKSDNLLNAMRRKVDEAEKRAANAEQLAQQYMQQQAAQQPQPIVQSQEEVDDLGVDNEDYVQAKHVKTSNKKISKKISVAEQKLAEIEQRLAYMQAKVDTSSLKDFDEVVSDDNLKTLAKLYPEEYETLRMNQNMSAKSKVAYNMIKNYGIMDGVKSANRSLDLEDKISQNKQRPQAASNASPQQPQTPLTRLGDYERRTLTESDRDRIMAEVERKKASW